jgi:hypothetical protein
MHSIGQRKNRPEMAASPFSDNVPSGIVPISAPQNPLEGLSTALDDFGSLASKIAVLKAEVLAQEAEVLQAILEKVTPLVPLLSRDYEAYYRRELVILTNENRVQLEKDADFYSEHKLVLYENGLLSKIHRYGEWSEGPRPAWELTEEEEQTPQAAITAFGLAAIADGLTKALLKMPSILILNEELEGRLASLAKVLEALTCTQ